MTETESRRRRKAKAIVTEVHKGVVRVVWSCSTKRVTNKLGDPRERQALDVGKIVVALIITAVGGKPVVFSKRETSRKEKLCGHY